MKGRFMSAALGATFGCSITGALFDAYNHWEMGMVVCLCMAVILLGLGVAECYVGEGD